MREEWEADGSPDARARALVRAREILDGHRPEPLPADAVREIDAIVARADAELAKS